MSQTTQRTTKSSEPIATATLGDGAHTTSLSKPGTPASPLLQSLAALREKYLPDMQSARNKIKQNFLK